MNRRQFFVLAVAAILGRKLTIEPAPPNPDLPHLRIIAGHGAGQLFRITKIERGNSWKFPNTIAERGAVLILDSGA